MAYDTIDPVGTWREDFRIASLQSMITNIVRSLYPPEGAKEPEMTNPADFMVDWGQEPEETKEPKKQTVEQMKQMMYAIAGAFGGNKSKKK